MKILVADHAFNIAVILVGGGGRAGQHVLGVENIQALVLHGTHVEVRGGDHHEAFQVKAQAEARFVPSDAGHQRLHGVICFIKIARAHINLQQVFCAVARRDALFAAHQFAGYQGKQITGFVVRVYPFCKMPAVFQMALLDQVAVGQQHRKIGFVGAQRDGEQRHHIRAIQEITDASETLGFALREERILADVQAGELGVLRRIAGGENFQLESLIAFGQVFQHQLIAVHLE